MKRKILLMLAIILALPLVLAGCGDSKVLVSLARDYNERIVSNENLQRVDNHNTTGKTDFELEHFVVRKSTALTSACTNIVAYEFLPELYEPMLYNALVVTYYYAPDMVNGNYAKDVKKDIYAKIDSLFASVDECVTSVKSLERSLTMDTNPTSRINLTHLKNVYVSYEKATERAFNLSECVLSYNAQGLSSRFTTMDYKNGNTQTQLFTALIKENYVARLYATQNFYYSNFYDNTIPAKIISGADGFNSLSVVNSFYGKAVYDAINAGINGVSTPNASAMQSNNDIIKARISNYLTAKKMYAIDRNSYNQARQVISYSKAKNTDSRQLTSEQADALNAMQNFVNGSLLDYFTLLNNIISLCK